MTGKARVMAVDMEQDLALALAAPARRTVAREALKVDVPAGQGR
jgi:hypothetical protein